MPKVGDVAPDFTLPSANGDVNLYKLLEANKAVVLFFYPKDETPGCTKEACAFRDAYQQFKGDGVEVVGISSDSVESHGKFAEHHKLPFVILSDAKGEIRKLYEYIIHSIQNSFFIKCRKIIVHHPWSYNFCH
eukprot:TRINITY_DN1913_c0_g1_i1.p1 TRINITY_DN1913_c0_g1~~TRINITY_DN1913_c0_g1_i1.p1  ORF type:complete len:133 (-),score=23.68 TRINITY_DN1913_c0_g1_i1:166-564(-)